MFLSFNSLSKARFNQQPPIQKGMKKQKEKNANPIYSFDNPNVNLPNAF